MPLVGMQRMVFDVIHTYTFGASQDIQLLVIIVGTAWTGKVLPHQRDPAAVHGLRCNLHPQNDRAHRDASRRCQHPSRATMQFRRVYSMRLEVGHLTLVDVETPRL